MNTSEIEKKYLHLIDQVNYSILETISQKKNIKSVALRNLICKRHKLMKESTFYRRMNKLLDYDLILLSGMMKKGGRAYILTNLGRFILNLTKETRSKIHAKIEQEISFTEDIRNRA